MLAISRLARHAMIESRNASLEASCDFCLLSGGLTSSSLGSGTIAVPPIVDSRVSASESPRFSGGMPHAKKPALPGATQDSPSWSAISPSARTR